MTNKPSRRAWQTPWGYTESAAIVAGVTIIGGALQLTIGSFNFFVLANPVNIFTGLTLSALSLFLGLRAPKSSFARWISGTKLSVSLIIAILALTIIMGLTPQIAEGAESRMIFGFDSMTSNWSFVLLYGLTLVSLGTLITRRALRFTLRDTPFMLNHLGIWLLLISSGLGYSDMERYIMYVSEGETQWRVYDDNKEVKELPIAIKLNDFDMDVYPPKLTIIDRETGEAQPLDKPQYMQIDNDTKSQKLGKWHIEVIEYIHNAIRSGDSSYREVPMPGATPAIHIKVTDGAETLEGWVCGGNQSQSYMTLALNEKYCVVMTTAEPRFFTSNVEVYTEAGDAVETTIEVNKPLRIGSWTIYQYGYDNDAGRLSSYSSFELVYDPWIVPVYIGIILMMLGALTLVWRGRKREINNNELD